MTKVRSEKCICASAFGTSGCEVKSGCTQIFGVWLVRVMPTAPCDEVTVSDYPSDG